MAEYTQKPTVSASIDTIHNVPVIITTCITTANNTITNGIRAGLSLLSEEDLEAMIEEMQAKFNRLSQSLVDGLQEREELIQEREVRHKFIAAVHQLVQHRENLSSGPGGGANLTVKDLKKLTSKKHGKEKSPVKVSCSNPPSPVRAVHGGCCVLVMCAFAACVPCMACVIYI